LTLLFPRPEAFRSGALGRVKAAASRRTPKALRAGDISLDRHPVLSRLFALPRV